MKTFRCSLVALMTLVLSGCLRVFGDDKATKVENADVLRNLADYDSIFMSGFTVSGTQTGKDIIIIRGPRLEGVKREWRFTFGDDRVAYRMNIVDYQKPKYDQLEPHPDPLQKKRFVGIRTRQWGYWGKDLSGNHYEDTVIAVAPTGEVTEKGKAYGSSVFGPNDVGPNAPKNIFLWSLGRFFSKHLNKVTQVKKSSDGRLSVSALGAQSEGYNGRWELEIEPDAAWMVRRARFYWDRKPETIHTEMNNTGIIWSGPCCIPKNAECNYWGPLDGADAVQITFEPTVEKFDEKLYSEAHEAVANNKRPTLKVHDFRVDPPVWSSPNTPESTQIEPRPLGRKWLLVGSAAAVTLIVALFMYFTWRKHQHRSAN
jgi:hypothetical protein